MSVVIVLGGICLAVGAAFGIIGAVGLLRFPDFFARMHAASVTDTLCAGLILLGLMFYSSSALAVIKLLLILFFLLFTTPTATHALAKAALHGGHKPLLTKKGEESSNRIS